MRGLDDTLRTAVERHGERAVLLCSFQKEESVLLDELLRIGDGQTPVRIVTIDTGVLFPETLDTWRQFEERFGVHIEVQDASRAAADGGPWSGPEDCCSVAKVAALERALEGAEAWITGIRREQGPTREDTELVETDATRGIQKYNPLALWSEKDLWRRIHERDLPYNPLHDRATPRSAARPAPCRAAAARAAGRGGRRRSAACTSKTCGR